MGRHDLLSDCYGHLPHMPSRDSLREQLRLVNSPSDANRCRLDAMRDCESVSVHVRRADYLLAANNSPTRDMSYQRRAMDVVRKKVASPR